MDTKGQILFSPIPLNELIEQIRSIVKSELTNSLPTTGKELLQKNKPVSTKELCEYLAVTEPTIIRWRKKKVIPFFTIGTAVRYYLADVIASLESTKSSNKIVVNK